VFGTSSGFSSAQHPRTAHDAFDSLTGRAAVSRVYRIPQIRGPQGCLLDFLTQFRLNCDTSLLHNAKDEACNLLILCRARWSEYRHRLRAHLRIVLGTFHRRRTRRHGYYVTATRLQYAHGHSQSGKRIRLTQNRIATDCKLERSHVRA